MVIFETSDIVLAAYLKTRGLQLQDIIKNGNKGTFVFHNINEQIIEEYDLGNSIVEPRSLNNEIKSLTTAARR